MTWIGWAAIIIGVVILVFIATSIWAAKAFADYGVKMIASFFKGPGGGNEKK